MKRTSFITLIIMALATIVSTASFASQDARDLRTQAQDYRQTAERAVRPAGGNNTSARLDLLCSKDNNSCKCTGGKTSESCRVMEAFICNGKVREKRLKCDRSGTCSCKVAPMARRSRR